MSKADKSLSAKAEKSGISLSTLRKVYRRGVAAWNSGHRPGTTPQQWGHARVNSYINKGKTYHTADKDLRSEEVEHLNELKKETLQSYLEKRRAPKISDVARAETVGKPEERQKDIERANLTRIGRARAKVKIRRLEKLENPQELVQQHHDLHHPYASRVPGVPDAPGSRYWGDSVEVKDINRLFEMQLVGTDEYRRHAIAMTPGQDQEIEDAFPVTSPNKSPIAVPAKAGEPIVPQYEGEHDCGCEGECECDEVSESAGSGHSGFAPISFKGFRKQLQEYALSQAQAEAQSEEDEDEDEEEGENDGVNDGVDFMPTLKRHKPDNKRTAPSTMSIRPTLDGLPITTQFATYEEKQYKGFMPTPRQVPAPPKGHPVPPGYMRVKSWGGGWELRKIPDWQYQKSVIRIGQTGHDEKLKKALGLKEAIEYHVENNISLTENIFRPGSEMFFEMINEAKKLYKEGAYEPKDEYERDLLESNIGEIAEYEGKPVVLDYPVEEGLEECWKGYAEGKDHINEEDETGGKGIGKPFRSGSGAAVYVRSSKGNVIKVNFSQSGMKKRYNEPARVRSFVARHKCLTNKDRTSASYWACRWPRYFSNSGQQWW